MSFIRRVFSRIAAIATMIIAASPISAISSSSSKEDPIAAATKFHTLVFFLYVIILVLAAIFQWWVWSTNNRLQDAIRENSDARIAEAKTATVKLENENLKLTGKVAGLQKDAAEAKAGQQKVQILLTEQQGKTATLEKAASDAKASQQSVEMELAVHRERAAKAERELLMLRERTEPRRLTDEQKTLLTKLFMGSPGEVTIECLNGDKEACEFAKELAGVLSRAGWSVEGPGQVMTFSASGVPPTGVSLRVARADKAPVRAIVLQNALRDIGVQVNGDIVPGMRDDELKILVGVKPSPR